MHDGEYFQHIYMILGRAQKLEWELIRSFPMTDEGEPDWGVFENGPPDYICEVFSILEDRARATRQRLLNAQRELGMPAPERIKPCAPDPETRKRFLYDRIAWGFTIRADAVTGPTCAINAKAQSWPCRVSLAGAFGKVCRSHD